MPIAKSENSQHQSTNMQDHGVGHWVHTYTLKAGKTVQIADVYPMMPRPLFTQILLQDFEEDILPNASATRQASSSAAAQKNQILSLASILRLTALKRNPTELRVTQ